MSNFLFPQPSVRIKIPYCKVNPQVAGVTNLTMSFGASQEPIALAGV